MADERRINDLRPKDGKVRFNESSIIRLAGAVLLEQDDQWTMQHRYMQVEGTAELDVGGIENTALTLTA